MRQLLVQVPRGCERNVLDIAKACDGTNLVQFEAWDSEKLKVGWRLKAYDLRASKIFETFRV